MLLCVHSVEVDMEGSRCEGAARSGARWQPVSQQALQVCSLFPLLPKTMPGILNVQISLALDGNAYNTECLEQPASPMI